MVVEVLPAELVETSVYMTVTPKDGYGMNEVRAACIQAINKYFAGLKIGQPALLAEIGRDVLALDGVANYSFVTTMCSDNEVSDTELAVPGEIGIAEGGV